MVRYWSCYGCGVATTFVWLIVVSVTLPDGNPGNLEPVLYGGQGSGVQIEVCIVPLCTPCLRDKPADAEYLLDELEKTQCVHLLTDLHEFATRRLRLAWPTDGVVSAVPRACPPPRNRVSVQHRCVEPRLSLWCPFADYDGHLDLFWVKRVVRRGCAAGRCQGPLGSKH